MSQMPKYAKSYMADLDTAKPWEAVDKADYDALRAYAEALEKDAMRYRWLRDIHAHYFTVTRHVGGATIPRFYGIALDAAIDAAMKGAE